jgi:hypothetical protein
MPPAHIALVVVILVGLGFELKASLEPHLYPFALFFFQKIFLLA